MRRAIALGAATLVLAGCGGDDGGGSDETAATRPETSATAPAPPPRPTLRDCLTEAGAQVATQADDLQFAQEAAEADELSFTLNQEIAGRVAQVVEPEAGDDWRVFVVAKPDVEPDAEAITDPTTADLVMYLEGDVAAIERAEECFAGEYDSID
jgi:hypothetical protein